MLMFLGMVTTVVYPYLHQLSQGNELRHSIRSLCKHLYFDFDIVIVGDKPDWYNGKHIQTTPIRNINFCRAFDIARKLQTIVESDLISDDFVYCYDDIYALSRVGWGYFGKVVALEPKPTKPIRTGSNKWNKMLDSTFAALGSIGTYNYETHLPRMFNKAKLTQLMNDYDLHRNPLLFSTLYFNEYCENPDIVLTEQNNIKAGLYGSGYSFDQIVNACHGKLWLNHSENAWGAPMDRFLKNNFPEKCKYEY